MFAVSQLGDNHGTSNFKRVAHNEMHVEEEYLIRHYSTLVVEVVECNVELPHFQISS